MRSAFNSRGFWALAAIVSLWVWQPLHTADKEVSSEKRRALYGSIDQRSVAQHLALYQLYPDSPEGQRALQNALCLLSPGNGCAQGPVSALSIPVKAIEAIVSLVNKQPFDQIPKLNPSELNLIEELAGYLPNRALAGHWVLSEAEVLALPPEQVDLARALFLSELGESPEALQTLRTYEAMIDLMALQLLARVDLQAEPHLKIRELNRFVFETMNFRFPPHSHFEKEIHQYTFLPSVLDTRRGVCLGVSILYTCLAQRLGIQLELITPPGHIFVRYKDCEREINVETTLRGVHIDSDEYLGVETRKLQQRNIKETVGLAHINEASVHFQEAEYDQALIAYQKARPYLPNDPLLQELMGYTHLLLGDENRGRALLEPLANFISPYTVGQNTLLNDVLDRKANASCLASLFSSSDDTAKALKAKRDEMESILREHPKFRTGWLHLATTLLDMHRTGEALTCFERYHALDDQNANVEFALATTYAERMYYQKSWDHLRQTKKILAAHAHDPDCVKELHRQLAFRSSE